MKARDLMTAEVVACGPNDSLECVARAMWEEDCGSVPIVDEDRRVLGMVTDRDACMAAYTQGRLLSAIPVHEAMSRDVISIGEEDSVEDAEKRMREHQVRRVPVVDASGVLTGVLSLNDLALAARGGRRGNSITADRVADTLAAVSRHRRQRTASATRAAE